MQSFIIADTKPCSENNKQAVLTNVTISFLTKQSFLQLIEEEQATWCLGSSLILGNTCGGMLFQCRSSISISVNEEISKTREKAGCYCETFDKRCNKKAPKYNTCCNKLLNGKDMPGKSIKCTDNITSSSCNCSQTIQLLQFYDMEK